MNAYQTYVDASERYERLYWANRACRALAKTQTTDMGGSYDPQIPQSAIVREFGPNAGRYRRRIIWLHSTLPGVRYMGQHERDALERQKALAPSVQPADVANAKRAMSAARKDMQAAKRQLKLAIA